MTRLEELLWRMAILECMLRSPRAMALAAFRAATYADRATRFSSRRL